MCSATLGQDIALRTCGGSGIGSQRNFGTGVAQPASSHEHARDTMGRRARGRALYPWHLALSKNAVMAKLGDKTRERGELINSRGFFDPLWTVAPIVS